MPIATRSALSPKLPASAPAPKPLQKALTSKPAANVDTPPAPNRVSAKAASGDRFADVFEGTKPAPNKPVGIVPDGVNPRSKPAGSASVPAVRVSGTAQVGTKPAADGPTVGAEVTTEASRSSRRGVERSGTIGGPSSNTPNEQGGTSASAPFFRVGDSVNESLGVGNEDVGASIGSEASYNAEASAGRDGIHVDIGGEVRAGAEAHASYSAGPFNVGADAFIGGRADAGVQFDAGPGGVSGGAHAGAFLGAEGSVHGGVDTQYGGVDAELAGQAGVGAEAQAYFEISPDGTVQFGAGAGIALGLGGKAGFSGEFNLVELANDVRPYVEQATDAVQRAQDVAEDVVEGAQDVAENVVDGVQDAAEAVGDFFGF